LCILLSHILLPHQIRTVPATLRCVHWLTRWLRQPHGSLVQLRRVPGSGLLRSPCVRWPISNVTVHNASLTWPTRSRCLNLPAPRRATVWHTTAWSFASPTLLTLGPT